MIYYLDTSALVKRYYAESCAKQGGMTYEIRTTSAEETQAWGERLARLLPPGAVIGLQGELGAGKTCFVKGLAAGLGIDEGEVSSPTFTLIAEHYRGRVPLYHVDLYRLEGPEQVWELGLDELCRDGVLVVEWPERAPEVLPEEHLLVRFEVIDEDTRELRLEARGKRAEDLVRVFKAEARI